MSKDYPIKTVCGNCGMDIFIHWSKKKGKEYPGNTMKGWEDFHQCPNWKEVPGVDLPKPKPQPEKPTFQSADDVPIIKGKVIELNISRTMAYKYGVSEKWAIQKEEIFNSLTYGVKAECDIDNNQDLEQLQTQYGKHIEAVLWEDFTSKRKLKLIKGEK